MNEILVLFAFVLVIAIIAMKYFMGNKNSESKLIAKALRENREAEAKRKLFAELNEISGSKTQAAPAAAPANESAPEPVKREADQVI